MKNLITKIRNNTRKLFTGLKKRKIGVANTAAAAELYLFDEIKGIGTPNGKGIYHLSNPLRTVYDKFGNSYTVNHTDIPMLLNTLERFIRCPRCIKTSTKGMHKYKGPCPKNLPSKWIRWLPWVNWVTYCDICKKHGVVRPFYIDPYTLLAVNGLNKKKTLMNMLQMHKVAFHKGEYEVQLGKKFKSAEAVCSLICLVGSRVGPGSLKPWLRQLLEETGNWREIDKWDKWDAPEDTLWFHDKKDSGSK